jgi:hypothetical protein
MVPLPQLSWIPLNASSWRSRLFPFPGDEGFPACIRLIWYEDHRSCIGVILLMSAAISRPSPLLTPRIIVQSERPALYIKNAHVDLHNNKVRGTAYLNFGYPVPAAPHVHVYAFAPSGKIVYESCDKLSRDRLTLNPPPHRGRDSFSASLPGNLNGITRIKIVARSGHDNCKLDDNRIFRIGDS